MDEIRTAIYLVAEADHPVTVRQVFYRLVSAGVIDKTENEYKSTVVRLLTEMRLAGELPYGWIADNTRWMRKPTTWDSLEDMLQHTAKTYRRNLWAQSKTRVEIWLEKEALAGVLTDVTYPWDVPLMVTRGYPSLTYIREAADAIAAAWLEDGTTTHLYYFGDHDPSGEDIRRHVEINLADHICEILQVEGWQRYRRKRESLDLAVPTVDLGGMARAIAEANNFDEQVKGLLAFFSDNAEVQMRVDLERKCLQVWDDFPPVVSDWERDDYSNFALQSKDYGYEPGSDGWVDLMEQISDVFTFSKIAVTPDQITEWDLITRPTKKTDSRSKNFVGESVEVDAIAPNDLRSLAEDAIAQHVDEDALRSLQVAEDSEREVLQRMAGEVA